MHQHNHSFRLSELEAWILKSIEHVGWYAYLWFPIVQRSVMNFGSDATDEQVHAAFASLIRKGALVVTQESWGHIPEWKLAPGALEAATRTIIELRGPALIQGYRAHRNSSRPPFSKLAKQYVSGDHWHLYEVAQSPPGLHPKYFWRDIWLTDSFPPAPSGAVPVSGVDIAGDADKD